MTVTSEKRNTRSSRNRGLKDEIEKLWRVKVSAVSVVIKAFSVVTPELEDWLQQVLEATSEISVQKSSVLGPAEILNRTLTVPGFCRGPEFEVKWYHPNGRV